MTLAPHPLLDTPPGVDPAVLAKINAFMNHPKPMPAPRTAVPKSASLSAKGRQRLGLTRRDASTMNGEGNKHGKDTAQKHEHGELIPIPGSCDWDKETSPQISIDGIDTSSSRLLPLVDEATSTAADSDADEKTPLLPHLRPTTFHAPPAPSHRPLHRGPTIVARAIYPSACTPPALLPRPARPSLASLLGMLYGLFRRLFGADEPAVIEYAASSRELRKRVRVRCEVQLYAVESTVALAAASASASGLPASDIRGRDGSESGISPSETGVQTKKTIVKAMLHVENVNDATGTSCVVPITAKPRRVRQLLRDYGVGGGVEDVYGREIKGALRTLVRMEGVMRGGEGRGRERTAGRTGKGGRVMIE